jgi:hypothetical protein
MTEMEEELSKYNTERIRWEEKKIGTIRKLFLSTHTQIY